MLSEGIAELSILMMLSGYNERCSLEYSESLGSARLPYGYLQKPAAPDQTEGRVYRHIRIRPAYFVVVKPCTFDAERSVVM